MSAPATAKKRLEAVVGLKALGASAAEVRTAARLCGQVADDVEVGVELRAEAAMRKRELELAGSQEVDAERRERAMGAAIATASRNV
jgi:hypothetical protein